MGADTLRVAFWNVENLFDFGSGVGRGPQSQSELDAKLDRLAECINSFFDGGTASPDLLALAEIGSRQLFDDLRHRLRGQYCDIWEEPRMSNQTGLGILAKEPIVDLQPVGAQRVTLLSRPRCLIVRCLLANRRSFLVVANHWKSRLPAPTAGLRPHQDRLQSARWVRDTLKELNDTCVIMLGDFNAEPTESYFDDYNLRCTYHFSKANYGAGKLDRFYNASWRFLTEPLFWEDWNSAGIRPREPRPKRTHSGGFVVWDQLLVSGYALRNGPIQLRERSVGYYAREGVNSRYNRAGVIEPVPWVYSGGNPRGASDHLPLLAEFMIE